MLFADDDTRHAFHQRSMLLQIVCNFLETHLAAHGFQVKVVESEHSEVGEVAVVSTDADHAGALQEAVDKVNRQFQRKDKLSTCVIENAEHRLLTLRVSGSTSLSAAH